MGPRSKTTSFLSIFKVSMIAVCILASGCVKRVHYRGKAPDLEVLSTLKTGQSTKNDVLNSLGSPTFETQYGEKIWFYVSKKVEHKAFLPPEETEKQTIALSFNKSGVLTKIEDLDPDLPDIVPVKNRTPSAIEERPLVKQIFANFGRIAKTGENKAAR